MDATNEVRALAADEWSQAAGLAARAMQSNPGFVWMLGDDPVVRTSQLYEFMALPPAPGAMVIGAWRGSLLLGCARMTRDGDCIGARSKLFGPPPPFEGEAPEGAARLPHIMTLYADNEPEWPHWHLGPIAVEPGLQGRGVGRQVMAPLIARLDDEGVPAWLETDKLENVRFYEAHGFEIDHHEQRFGVDAWLMHRHGP